MMSNQDDDGWYTPEEFNWSDGSLSPLQPGSPSPGPQAEMPNLQDVTEADGQYTLEGLNYTPWSDGNNSPRPQPGPQMENMPYLQDVTEADRQYNLYKQLTRRELYQPVDLEEDMILSEDESSKNLQEASLLPN